MTLDDEVRAHVSQMQSPPLIIDEWEWLADILTNSFEWKGSKIDWSKTNGHKCCTLNASSGEGICFAKKFLSDSGVARIISSSERIFYINDSSLDFSLMISPGQFEDVFEYLVVNVPQHHYFFDVDNGWCLVFSSEGYVDFGGFK